MITLADFILAAGDSLNTMLYAAMVSMPDVPTIDMSLYVTSEVRTGLSWLAWLLPLPQLMAMLVAWLLMVVGITAFNFSMSGMKLLKMG